MVSENGTERLQPALGLAPGAKVPERTWGGSEQRETWDQFNLCHPSTSVGVVEAILDPLGVTQSVDVM